MSKVDKTVIRTRKNKENPYVMIDKFGLNDERLTFKAKGILSYLLSKPDDWQIRLSDLIKKSKDGRDSVKAGLRELEDNGYLSRNQLRDGNGKFGDMEYIIYERPIDVDIEPNSPRTENPLTDENAGNSTANGKSVNGKSVNGKTVDGESTPTNNDITNNDLTNINGWMGELSPQTQKEWDLFKGFCKDSEIDGSQTIDLYKVWRYQYKEAPISIVIATLRELMHDKYTRKNGKWTEIEYKNLVGVFHHRMQTWREMAVAFDDIDNNDGGWDTDN